MRHVIIVAPGSHLDECREAAAGYHPVDGQQHPADDQQHLVDDQQHRADGEQHPADGQQHPADREQHLADGEQHRVDVVAGGADRSASVEAGLVALRHDDGIVLVHDVARCLAPSDLFARVIRAVRSGHPAVVPGLPVHDTVKVVDAAGRVLATPDRESLRGIQTPQGFLREVLEHAHAQGGSATDDAGLVERAGGHVRVVPGDPRALKITSPLDLTIATALLQDPSYAG